MKESLICDLDNRTEKRALLTWIGALRGRWCVELTRERPQRSLNQNRWYRGCIVQAFYQFLREQDWSISRPEDAHRLIAKKFLTVDIVNKGTGEVFDQQVRSTTELTTAEFADYCDRARAWLLDMFGIIVPDPE